jgi:filamin
LLIFFSDAGVGDLAVVVTNDATKQAVPVKIIDNEDNTYTVELSPKSSGVFDTVITYGGKKVPFNKKTLISPTVDVSKIQVEGLEASELIFASARDIHFCLRAFC